MLLTSVNNLNTFVEEGGLERHGTNGVYRLANG